ncbi:pectin lyase-like protein [Piromyces finnis]|uniref:Pectin lyase-like protein n=1 Tax=Piromyces finnis TaxID=1754191 RepID=A0A1Y1UZ16_9FUNG|nr:pectin lyase-like protein [Piromyces finnis]|eukprot:ORX43648.1 pectin lyase-like protein [Piromyces finnis]
MKTALIIIVTILNYTTSLAANCSQPYYQCGGSSWNGLTCCTSGYSCKKFNEFFSQCVPSNNSSPDSTTKKITKKTTTATKKATTKKTTTKKTTVKKTSKITTTKKTATKTTNIIKTKNPSISNSSSLSNVNITELIGYASLNGGTIGGQGGQTYTVSNQSQLESALANNDKKIIIVDGIIKLTSDIIVNSNTSLIGANKNSGFTNGGIKMKNAKNIIIQNLKFSYCLGSNKDCINAQKSTNIWVDHCEFFNDRNHGKDYYDGLIDFTHASDYITISWCSIHDHYKASLIGHSDTNGNEDTGKLHITYHHNYFKNVGSRLPSLRFGTGHVFNNVYENIESSCVNVRMGAQALVENNVFLNANKPISTNLDSSQEGSVIQRNNDFGTTSNTNSITSVGTLNSVPYKYTVDNVNSIYKIVINNAGTH